MKSGLNEVVDLGRRMATEGDGREVLHKPEGAI